MKKQKPESIVRFRSEEATLLHYATELAICVETNSYPKTDFTNLQLRGALVESAFIEAFDEAITSFPIATSHLVNKRIGLGRRLFWVQDLSPNKLITGDLRNTTDREEDPATVVQQYHEERIQNRINLFADYPVYFFLLRLADDLYVFSIVFHHISLDAAKGYDIVKKIFGRYHEKVTGQDFPWETTTGISSDHVHVAPTPPQPFWAFFKDQMKDLFINSQKTISQVATSGKHDRKGRTMHHATFDNPRTLGGMKAHARKNQATLGDVICASVSKTISLWDGEHGSKKDRIRGFLAVNVRNRIQAVKHESVALSGLNITIKNPGEMDLDEVIRITRDLRTRQLAKGTDVALHKFVESLGRMLRFFPKGMRDSMIRNGLRSPLTFIMSNMGILWPEVKDGRLTGDSTLVKAGDLVIEDMYSCPSMTPDVGMGVFIRTHARRLFISYSCDRWRFTDQEAKELTNRLTSDLRSLGESAYEEINPQ